MLGDVVSKQMLLFGKPEVQTTKSQYWIANSSTQKFIRRGMADQAVKTGQMMFGMNPMRLRKRLMVIMMEDIGLANLPLMYQYGPELAHGHLGWTQYEKIIRDFAASVKNRDSDDGSVWPYDFLRKGRVYGVTMPDPGEVEFMNEVGEYLTDSENRDLDKAFWEDMLKKAKAKGPRLVKLIRFLRPFRRQASWHANHLAMLAVWRWDAATDALRPPVGVKTDPECRTDFEYMDEDDVFPDFGMDNHTRPGKTVIRKLTKEYELEKRYLASWTFYVEGCRLDRWAHWENDYRELVQEAKFPHETRPTCMEVIHVPMRNYRIWTWQNRVMPAHEAEMAKMKKV